MDINRMSDEELAKELRRIYWSNPVNGGDIGDICDDDIKLAKFTRQCVKDSMPTEEEIIKIIERICQYDYPDYVDNIKNTPARVIAHALREAMEGDTKLDERKGEGKDSHVA